LHRYLRHPRRTLLATACAVSVALTALGPAAPSANAAVRLTVDQLLRTLSDTGLRESALRQALRAMARNASRIRNPRFLTLIDLGRHSSRPRLFLIDLETGHYEALLVAHGRGSDRDHDGYAEAFSNMVGSRMSSLGAYVTANTYHGQHGLSLRLVGLNATNDRAMERAIVMHGADYVAPGRDRMGRSWGCPAIERRHVKRLLPKLANGSFLYITK
jgi:hypothetical protein